MDRLSARCSDSLVVGRFLEEYNLLTEKLVSTQALGKLSLALVLFGGDNFHQFVDVLFCVLGHEGDADSAGSFWDCWRADGRGEEVIFVEFLGEVVGGFGIAGYDRDDLGGGVEGVDIFFCKYFVEVAAVFS